MSTLKVKEGSVPAITNGRLRIKTHNGSCEIGDLKPNDLLEITFKDLPNPVFRLFNSQVSHESGGVLSVLRRDLSMEWLPMSMIKDVRVIGRDAKVAADVIQSLEYKNMVLEDKLEKIKSLARKFIEGIEL